MTASLPISKDYPHSLKSNMTGNDDLIADIETLLMDAQNDEFDDMRSEQTFPKLSLVARLQSLIENVKSGKYD